MPQIVGVVAYRGVCGSLNQWTDPVVTIGLFLEMLLRGRPVDLWGDLHPIQ